MKKTNRAWHRNWIYGRVSGYINGLRSLSQDKDLNSVEQDEAAQLEIALARFLERLRNG